APRPPVRRLRPPALRRWWTDAVGLAIWISMLVVVALWVQHGGVQDLAAGMGSALSSLGRLTGLVSADLLLLQVLGMARIPWVERAYGQDWITRTHRLLGFWSVNLMVAHLLLITLGYAALDEVGVLGELWSLVTTAPGMLLAAAGTAALLMVAATSIRRARRRLRYESWHLLHLYAYLGAGLALPHQLWTGRDFLASTAATVYWWTLWALAVVAVLVFRVVVPLRTSMRQGLTVSQVLLEAPGVISVVMTGPRLAELEVAAGQFFVFRFRTGRGWTRGHPLSLSAAPTTAALRVTVGITGDDGERLARMRPGTRVLLEGPYGRLRPEVRTRPGMVLIGSGLGIAPLVALAQHAVLAGAGDRRPATLVRRIRSGEAQPLQADLDHLVTLGALRVVDLVGPRSDTGTAWLPRQLGHVPGPQAARQLVGDLEGTDVFVCGAAPWAEAVAADLLAAGLPPTALHVERFTW
ncbi:MAG TPA: ferric reductase-like transmembrane domain-containing protein, partial [Actinotalea sp.]|nr:ferric reductase-like transmembrane domain-containing protein [Actinotalea sp.]